MNSGGDGDKTGRVYERIDSTGDPIHPEFARTRSF